MQVEVDTTRLIETYDVFLLIWRGKGAIQWVVEMFSVPGCCGADVSSRDAETWLHSAPHCRA